MQPHYSKKLAYFGFSRNIFKQTFWHYKVCWLWFLMSILSLYAVSTPEFDIYKRKFNMYY